MPPWWRRDASARATATPRLGYQIRRPSPPGDGPRRHERELLASWPCEGEGCDRRAFEPPLRSPLQVWRLDGSGSSLLAAVGSGFLVLGVSVHEDGAEFTTVREPAVTPEPESSGPIVLERRNADAAREEVDHRAA